MNIRKTLYFLILLSFLQFILNCPLFAKDKRKIELTLEKVSQLALINNLDIQITKYDAYIKCNNIYDAISIFDSILNASISYEDDQLQRTSTLGATKSKTTDYGIDLSKKTRTGTTIGVGFDHTRGWSDSAYSASNPSHESQATVSVKQEVGKNFFGLIDRTDVKVTKLDIENSGYTSLDKIESYLADAQKAYWNVILSREKVEIREEMLDRALSLYKIYKQKVKMGLAENPDLYAAEANMNIRKNQLLISQNNLRMAENDLLLKLNLEDRDEIEIVIDEEMSVAQTQEQLFLESLRMAIDNRRDYKKAINDVEAKKLNLVMKENNLWPEIDLEASFVRNGVAQQFKDAARGITASDNPKYYFGINFKYPLENSEAKGQFKSAEFDKAKALVLLKKKEREVVVEVHDSVGTVNTTLENARNNYTIVQLQEAKLKEEEKRFKLGRSDSDTLIRYHDDLLIAKISLVDSLYEYYSDFIDLRVKENSLLDEYWESGL